MARTRLHPLENILIIAFLGVLCGAEGFVQIEMFGKARRDWLSKFLDLSNGIPSHDCFGRVFAMLDPVQFEQCMMRWIEAMVQASEQLHIAIDGKTLRRSFQAAGGKGAVHMLNAFCSESQMIIGQLATDERSNEITAIPQLLEMLNLAGTIVTVDALNCQKDIAQTILDGGGDYVMQVKANHKTEYKAIRATLDEEILWDFENLKEHDSVMTVDGDHGRIEVRRLYCTTDIDWLKTKEQWPGLQSIAVVECQRQVMGSDKPASIERRYYLSSLTDNVARQFLRIVRGHWGVENQAHWTLDVAYREDNCRIRTGNAAENMARVRRMTLNVLKRDSSTKAGIASKRLKCSWDEKYLCKVLNHATGKI